MKITANIAEDIIKKGYAAKKLEMDRMTEVRFTELRRCIPIGAVSDPEGTETLSSRIFYQDLKLTTHFNLTVFRMHGALLQLHYKSSRCYA
jgi:hypothetical protein